MNYTLQKIYDVFRDWLSICNPNCKSYSQYNPHNGFSIKSYFKTQQEKDFEQIFPAMLVQGQDLKLQMLVKNMKTSVGGFKVKHKTYQTYCMRFLDFMDVILAKKTTQAIQFRDRVESAYHIDGVENLVTILGGERNFIKTAVKNSYFFHPDLVLQRFKEIVTLFSTSQPIPARWQGVRVSGIRPQSGYAACDIDTNGNAKVRGIIKTKTGYTISAGNTIFTNYKISHIWANAVDPRYYTNLWNIVLIPAWANDLLDKQNSANGSLASKMLNTYMELCNQIYQMNKLPFNNINLPMPRPTSNAGIVKGIYQYNEISGLIGSTATCGDLSIKMIKI